MPGTARVVRGHPELASGKVRTKSSALGSLDPAMDRPTKSLQVLDDLIGEMAGSSDHYFHMA